MSFPVTVAPQDRELVMTLAATALRQAAPEELVLLDETARDYFTDPASTLAEDTDEAISAGIDVPLLAPYLLAAAQVALPLLGTFAAEIAKDAGKDLVKEPLVGWVRRFVKRSPDEPAGPVALTREQALHVRQAVVENCRRLNLPSDTAAVVADATIGSLHVRP
jgi:hypothetical protein